MNAAATAPQAASMPALSLRPLDLISGPGYCERLELVLSDIARDPSVCQGVCTCSRCGKQARPYWSLLGLPGDGWRAPLPWAWELTKGTRGDPICSGCISKSIDSALKAMVAYANSPAGRAQMALEEIS